MSVMLGPAPWLTIEYALRWSLGTLLAATSLFYLCWMKSTALQDRAKMFVPINAHLLVAH